jgi:hypothetical protein
LDGLDGDRLDGLDGDRLDGLDGDRLDDLDGDRLDGDRLARRFVCIQRERVFFFFLGIGLDTLVPKIIFHPCKGQHTQNAIDSPPIGTKHLL